MAPTAPDLDLDLAWEAVRRRPVLHLAAMLVAAVPLYLAVRTTMTTGLSSLWPVARVVVGAAAAASMVVATEGRIGAEPVAWTELDLDAAELHVPPPPREGDGGWGRAGLCLWLGWVLGVVAAALAAARDGLLGWDNLVGLVFFAFWMGIPAIWVVALLPQLAPRIPALRPRRTRVRLEPGAIVVDGRRLALGSEQARLEEDGARSRLTLDSGGDQVVIDGDRHHVHAIYDRVRAMPRTGGSEEVPAALRGLRGQRSGTS